MRLERRVQHWQEAGIIDAATAERLLAHESHARRPLVLASLAGLGACTIGVGVISVIAANWGDIPPLLRLLAMLGLLCANAYGLAQAYQRQHGWLREALAIGYFGLTLASIALLGQTYQLRGEPYQALVLWLAVGTPALWLAQSAWAALVFFGALCLSGGALFLPLVECFSQNDEGLILVSAGLLSGLLFGPLLLASVPVLRRYRPAFAVAYARLGWSLFVLAATLGVHVWYVSISPTEAQKAWIGLPVVGLFVGLSLWRVQGLSSQPRPAWLLPARLLIIYAAVVVGGGVLLPHGHFGLLGALGFIGLWALLAWCSYQAHRLAVVNLATALIAARLFIAYIEIFGSLLATGMGLIGSGLALLLLVWVWVRTIRLQPGEAL